MKRLVKNTGIKNSRQIMDRFLCFCLAIITAFILIARNTNNAIDYDPDFQDQGEIIDNNYNYLADEAVDLFSNEDFLKGVKERIDNPSDDLRIVKYLMEDGTAEMRIFNEPIKYVAEDGTVHTKSTEIVKIPDNTKYGYSNLHNDVRMQFGSHISDGVLMEFNGHSLYVFPATESLALAELTHDNKTVKYNGVFSDNINVEYMADYSGLKENIVIEQYAGINSFSFIIETEDTVIDNNGTIELVDKNGNNIGNFGAVFVTDANGKSIYGYSSVSKLEGPKFLYTLIVPEDYLTDSNTIYPVNVDPTFTFNFYTNNFAGYKQIYDVTLYQTGYTYQPGAETLNVNSAPYYGRVIVKFPNITSILSGIGEDNILNVNLSYYAFTQNTATVYVNPMTVNWSHYASSLTNDTYTNLYNGYNSNITLTGAIHYGPGIINITSIALNWLNNEYPNRGIIISGMSSSILGSTECQFGYSRPYISIEYIYEAETADCYEGLFKLIPYDANGLMVDYAMKNDNSVIMTSITDNVYDSDQLLLISKDTLGYTIQNPYNDKYLTSNNGSVSFSLTKTSGSYWSFVDSGYCGGVFIVGTSQEQLNCLTPGVAGSSVSVLTWSQGISTNQAAMWVMKRQIDKIPFKLKNVYSGKYLTVDNAYDKDDVNIYQHSEYTITGNNPYNPVFGSQGIRPKYDYDSSSFKLYLICSKNGRFRTITWNNTGNVYEYRPSTANNMLSISISTNGYATIKQKTGAHLALTVTDDNDGSADGTGINSQGNIVFNTYDSSNTKQKWILELNLEQFKKEAYYSHINIDYPLSSSSNIITSDFGPRTSGSAIHDGLDLSDDITAEVKSAFSGTVKRIRINYPNPLLSNPPKANRGIYVVVESNMYNIYGTNEKICAIYQHLDTYNTSLYVGQTIQAGTIIGTVGITGLLNSDSHLHYSIFPFSAFLEINGGTTQKDQFVDPLMIYNNFSFKSNDIDLEKIE